jgi:hypothetical protein
MHQWIKLDEIAALFGLSEESILRMSKSHGLPLKRVTPFATPGCLEEDLVKWLKRQPRIGKAVRAEPASNQRKAVKANRRANRLSR